LANWAAGNGANPQRSGDIWRVMPIQVASDGDVIVASGDQPTELYLVDEGTLHVVAHTHDRAVKVNELKAGEVFGELAFLDGGPASADVVAHGSVTLRVMDQPTFNEWAAMDPAGAQRFSDELARTVSLRMRRLTDLIAPLQVRRWQATLLGAAAHDLRTPLSVISGALETVLDNDHVLPAATQRQLLSSAQSQAERLRTTLDGLLELSRLQVSAAVADRRPLDLATCINNAVELLDTSHHHVVVDADSVVATVDPLHVDRILDNLVRNALHHAPQGSTIRVHARMEESTLLLVVEDEGPGVPPAVREQIFRPFVGGREGGTGLGLAIVLMFAELNGGDAWVEDRPGGGASFRVALPSVAAPVLLD